MKIYYFCVFITMLLACKGNSDRQDFVNKVNAIATISPDTSVKLNDIINSEWDQCIIAHPYVSIDQLSRKYSMNLKKLAKTGIEIRDDVSILCISKNDEIVTCYELPRHIYSFENGTDTVIENKDSKIKIQKDKKGKILLKVYN